MTMSEINVSIRVVKEYHDGGDICIYFEDGDSIVGYVSQFFIDKLNKKIEQIEFEAEQHTNKVRGK